VLLARHPADSPWLTWALGAGRHSSTLPALASASGVAPNRLGQRLGQSPRAPPCATQALLKLLALSWAAHRHCPSLPAALWRLGIGYCLGHFLENLALGIISALISTITSRPLKNGIIALEHCFGHATGISALGHRFGHATTIALAALNLATGSVGCVSCRLSIRGLLFLGLCYCLSGSTISSRVLLLGLSAHRPTPLVLSYRFSGSAIAFQVRLSPITFEYGYLLSGCAIASRARLSPLGFGSRLWLAYCLWGSAVTFRARLSPLRLGYRLSGSAVYAIVAQALLTPLGLSYRLSGPAIDSRVRLSPRVDFLPSGSAVTHRLGMAALQIDLAIVMGCARMTPECARVRLSAPKCARVTPECARVRLSAPE
jgi:hypothetical protein